jgi:hypothetical protein
MRTPQGIGVPIILWPEVDRLSIPCRKLGRRPEGTLSRNGNTMAFRAPSTCTKRQLPSNPASSRRSIAPSISSWAPFTVVPQVNARMTPASRSSPERVADSASRLMAPSGLQVTEIACMRRMRAALGIE